MYSIYILGGYYVKADKGFGASVTDVVAGKGMQVKKKRLGRRDYFDGKRGVQCFEFSIEKGSEYDIVLYGYENIIVKRSMLWSLRYFQQPLELSKIGVAIIKTFP